MNFQKKKNNDKMKKIWKQTLLSARIYFSRLKNLICVWGENQKNNNSQWTVIKIFEQN